MRRWDQADAARASALGLPQQMPIGLTPAVGLLATAPPARPIVDEEERGFFEALLGIATGISNAHSHAQATRLNRDLDREDPEIAHAMELGRAFSRVSEVEVARFFGLDAGVRSGWPPATPSQRAVTRSAPCSPAGRQAARRRRRT